MATRRKKPTFLRSATIVVACVSIGVLAMVVYAFWYMADRDRKFLEEREEWDRRSGEVVDSAERTLREIQGEPPLEDEGEPLPDDD